MSIVHRMDLMTGLECEFFTKKGNQTENKIKVERLMKIIKCQGIYVNI